MEAKESQPQRPPHRRAHSSKSNILRSLVPSKSAVASPETHKGSYRHNEKTQVVPLQPADQSLFQNGRVLGERQSNVQSPPSSPSKGRVKSMGFSRAKTGLSPVKSPAKLLQDDDAPPKKSKSSNNLAAVFAKMNRSSKDLSAPAQQKDKENATPPTSATEPPTTPIWAQYATRDTHVSRPTSRDGKDRKTEDEIFRYTPRDHSPEKQRNFNGSYERPGMRPTLSSKPHAARPQSAVILGIDLSGAVSRRVSGDKDRAEGRKSEDVERQKGNDGGRRSRDTATSSNRNSLIDRKVSGSSAEQAPAKEGLNVTKRGGRVMAAVAAFQGRSKAQGTKDDAEPVLDPKDVDHAFEAVLDARNVPEPMRQKMRSLTMRVKADFIKQEQGTSKRASGLPAGIEAADFAQTPTTVKPTDTPPQQKSTVDDGKSSKRSRSRGFTFTRSDKRGEASPSKKDRSHSKSRPNSSHESKESVSGTQTISAPTTPRNSSDKRNSQVPALPTDYIGYLRKNQDPVVIEVGRLHKLRILLRNETVAWVDSFVSLGGMTDIVGLLHRIMAVEWREEHEDCLLHESLLCLKGLCTTAYGMAELEKVADTLFPALMAMLYDEENKGPAEYSTRTIITNILFNFLSSALDNAAPEPLPSRAHRILAYLQTPSKPSSNRPVAFVADMHLPRPYKHWCREVTNVTKEVFWIFLHHLNVIPLPESSTTDHNTPDDAARAEVLAQTYTHRHFPGARPPVPAAPYIGGVEWDATTYLTSHLDLLNGLLASLPSSAERNALRGELQRSGFEKVLGGTLRTCKEKFYGGVHDGLRVWVAAAVEDGWEVKGVREGEGRAGGSPRKAASPVKEAPPKLMLDVPGLGGGDKGVEDDGGWLG